MASAATTTQALGKPYNNWVMRLPEIPEETPECDFLIALCTLQEVWSGDRKSHIEAE